jgi:flagellar biosynthesis protein FlhG
MKEEKRSKRSLGDIVRLSAADGGMMGLQEAGRRAAPAASQAICVASGKGGTGKTIFSTNIGVMLARQNFKVTLIDADLGLANAHLLLGLDPAHDVSQLVGGELTIDDVLVDGPYGLKILPGGSGIAELADLNEGKVQYLAHQLMQLDERSDVTLVDCSAGITRQVLRFLSSAHGLVVVTTPEVTSMIDGYAVIKNVYRLRPDMPIWLVVNRIKQPEDAETVFDKMRTIVRKRLGKVKMSLLGAVPHDRYVSRSVMVREPVVLAHPRSFATLCFKNMASTIAIAHARWKAEQRKAEDPAFSYFWSLARRRYE